MDTLLPTEERYPFVGARPYEISGDDRFVQPALWHRLVKRVKCQINRLARGSERDFLAPMELVYPLFDSLREESPVGRHKRVG